MQTLYLALAFFGLLRLVFIRRGSFEELLCFLLPYRDIAREDGLYLRRFYLTPRSWPVRIFLHHIVKPDPDAHQHDHPWGFLTVGFGGWYAEESTVPCDCSGKSDWTWGVHRPQDRVGFLSVRRRRATYRHRITAVSKGGAWTLVFAGRASREWGFWVEDPKFGCWPNGGKWQPWYQYLNVPNDTAPEDAVRGG